MTVWHRAEVARPDRRTLILDPDFASLNVPCLTDCLGETRKRGAASPVRGTGGAGITRHSPYACGTGPATTRAFHYNGGTSAPARQPPPVLASRDAPNPTTGVNRS